MMNKEAKLNESDVEAMARRLFKLASKTDNGGLATAARAGAEALLDVLDAMARQEVDASLCR
jgi:hypothetical protein